MPAAAIAFAPIATRAAITAVWRHPPRAGNAGPIDPAWAAMLGAVAVDAAVAGAAAADRGQVRRAGRWRDARHSNQAVERRHGLASTALALAPPCLMAWRLPRGSDIPIPAGRPPPSRAGTLDPLGTTRARLLAVTRGRPSRPTSTEPTIMTATTLDSTSATGHDGWLIRHCERGRVADSVIRGAIAVRLWQRLRAEHADDDELRANALNAFVEALNRSPIAVDTQAANRQYEAMPASFFAAHLGPRLKSSCCYFPNSEDTLARAEDAMLALYAERAELADGQRMLDLGCGWGALSLWLAERYPGARIVGLSSSRSQRAFIEQRAAERGLTNLTIVTGNVADFEFAPADARFDRVLSIEMFEHMRNYRALLTKISHWLADDGKLFVHLFAHRLAAYPLSARDGNDWLSRHFFTGGTMPSADLLLRFQDHLRVQRQWWLGGMHYARTANHWLASLDAAHEQIMPTLREAFGDDAAPIVFQRWRMFYLAVAGLFGFRRGHEWGVAHYLFDQRAAAGA